MEAFAQWTLNYPAFPSLWAPHCILMSVSLRSSFGESWRRFSRQHPLSCFLLAILYTFPGGIISACLLGEPVLFFLLNTPFVATMVTSWYLVFYSPGDIFFRLMAMLRLRIPMSAMQDFLRLHLVLSGVNEILLKHPSAILYPIVFAICKSSGFMFLKYAEYVISNGPKKAFVLPHHSTKTCILASVLITLCRTGHLEAEAGNVFAFLVLIAISFRTMTAITDMDPYEPLENFVCKGLFGSYEVEVAQEVKDTKKTARKVTRTIKLKAFFDTCQIIHNS